MNYLYHNASNRFLYHKNQLMSLFFIFTMKRTKKTIIFNMFLNTFIINNFVVLRALRGEQFFKCGIC